MGARGGSSQIQPSHSTLPSLERRKICEKEGQVGSLKVKKEGFIQKVSPKVFKLDVLIFIIKQENFIILQGS